MAVSDKCLAKFRDLETQLKVLNPGAIDGANDLAANLIDPHQATKQEIWERLWDKPFFSARYVSAAERDAKKLKLTFDRNLRKMAFGDPDFGIRRKNNIGRGKALVASSFNGLGRVAKKICNEDSIARHRYYAAVSSGRWLNENFDVVSETFNLSLEKCVKKLSKELGPGWGHITVMHFLTDLGICCKPDIHLIAAAEEIGIFSDQRNPQKSLPAAIAIDRSVRDLVQTMHGEVTPQQLRYADKVLMEISRKILSASENSRDA